MRFPLLDNDAWTRRGGEIIPALFSSSSRRPIAASPCQLNQRFPSRFISPFSNEEIISLQVLSSSFALFQSNSCGPILRWKCRQFAGFTSLRRFGAETHSMFFEPQPIQHGCRNTNSPLKTRCLLNSDRKKVRNSN